MKASDVSLYSISETSPFRSPPKDKSRSVLEEVREKLQGDVKVEEEGTLEHPLGSNLSSPCKSPRSGKVEILADDSEFKGELKHTVFSNMGSPEGLAAVEGSKWASPRVEEKAEAQVGGLSTPTKASPSKPSKPARPPKLKGPSETSESVNSSQNADAAVSAFTEPVRNVEKGTKELDSGLGLHHVIECQEQKRIPDLRVVLNDMGIGEGVKSVTPDTLSPFVSRRTKETSIGGGRLHSTHYPCT